MNTPTEIRDGMFAQIRPSTHQMNSLVWELLGKHGPCTTRQLADRSGLSILSVRPRVTELLQMGLVALTGREGREGVYSQVPSSTFAPEMAAEAVARGEQRLLF